MKEQNFVEIARALADTTRFEILSRIAHAGELACADLVQDLSITPATISHHIKELSSAGLVKSRRDGKFHFYSVKPKIWNEYLKELSRRVPAQKA